MEIGKKINSKIKKDSRWDYKFNFSNMTSLEKLKNSMPITDEQIDAYAEQINICLDNLKDKSASFSISNRDYLFEDGLTGATEKLQDSTNYLKKDLNSQN